MRFRIVLVMVVLVIGVYVFDNWFWGIIEWKLYYIFGILIIIWEIILLIDYDLFYRGYVLYKCDDIVC